MTKDDTIYEGNLIIESAADAKKYKNLTKVTGNMSIYSSAKLDALKSVGGYLSINSSAKLDALKSVGGDLYIYSSVKLDALKSVGGDLYIYSSVKLDAPKLESVGGDLSINSSAKLDALKSVGGDLYINSDATLVANKLYTGGYDKFKIYDGIPCVVLSSKQKAGMIILSCRQPKIKNQKIIGDKFYIAKKDGHNAHGKTIEEAVSEIQFKIGKRNISEFKNMPKTTKKTPSEWAMVYRLITGACQYGVKNFMEQKGKLKKEYSLEEIITETKGAYGSDRFRSVVTG